MILVTGGAGYIGTHTLVELIAAGYSPVVFDNFCNSSINAIERVTEITGVSIPVYTGDVVDRADLRKVFEAHPHIDSVIHLAGLKAVGDSVVDPLSYYENNVVGTLALCDVMQEFGCRSMVFSSSATVYGDPATVPIDETFPLKATNPYGRTKIMVEEILRDLFVADSWKIALLRYFNPVGAHSSGLIGENPAGTPNNLMPYLAQVAVGRRDMLSIFGGDYPTLDGTGVRDYIHVVDLAKGHVKALQALDEPKVLTVNLGTGVGYSVLQLIHAFESASGKTIPYEITARRPGDIAVCYTDPTEAQRLLGWSAVLGVDDMCRDVWRWQSRNPDGY
ncbi:UDP-glucose 4-epimerase GalE [Pseudomonas fluorescens]|uniref:UDP-glucose 4-epimerase GalE n=1 Tax=Pseudomonas fluorescens TaxID=294 RepID=UPI0009E30AFC|nr:UDP-glucose 4-epimerase GalE [Pseudomonas fluorescens]